MRWTRVLLAVAGLLTSIAARALDCGQDFTHVTHFQHTAWTEAEGAPPDIWALAQSPDRYLWLGTGAGLYKFDGIHFESVHVTAGSAFPAVDITALLAARSNEIWIGYESGGVSVLRDDRLTNFTRGVPKGAVRRLAEDQDHTIWVLTDQGLARYFGGSWQQIDDGWNFPAGGGNDLLVAGDGTLWVTISAGRPARQDRSMLAFLRRGSRHFELSDEHVSIRAGITQSTDGRLWVSDHAHGARPLPGTVSGPSAKRELHDRGPFWGGRRFAVILDNDGGLWGLHESGGIFHLSPQLQCASTLSQTSVRLERITLDDGLTSNIAGSLITDREGNVWAGTNLGLDRFRAATVVTETSVPLTSSDGYRGTPGKGGAFYSTANQMVFQIGPSGGSKVIYRSPTPITFLHTTKNGDLWLGSQSGLLRFRDTGWTRVRLPKAPAAATVIKMEEDPRGRLWIALLDEGIFRFENHKWQKFEPRADLARRAPNLITIDVQGRMWLYYLGGPFVLIEGTGVREFSAVDGPAVGDIQFIGQSDHGVIVAGELGIARYDGQRFWTLPSSMVPALSRITGIVQTAAGDTWINGIMGIVQVSTRDLEFAFAHPSRSLPFQLLDFRHGLPGVAQQSSYEPTALEGTDGRLWFITSHGIAWIDPTHLVRNRLPPPVTIRSVMANGRRFPISAEMTLPSQIANLQIDYNALNLTAPDRVIFRYQLEGVDKGWVEAGSRGQAFYTSLVPGSYRFHVIAANEDGVWNHEGAALDFDIPPTFFQSQPFKVVGLSTVAGLIWLTFSLRLRTVESRMRLAASARLNERERIARELHDTLLQGFQGLMLRLQAVADSVKNESSLAHRLIEQTLEQADAVLGEGRDRVQDLRACEVPSANLSQVFIRIAEDAQPHPATVRVSSEGAARELHPIAREEITRIGREAIANAVRHAKASMIEVEIAFKWRQFSLRISDDGVGIDMTVVRAGRQGHFGLTGMRERARQIRGVITIASRLGGGTEVMLAVPAAIAYAHTRAARLPTSKSVKLRV